MVAKINVDSNDHYNQFDPKDKWQVTLAHLPIHLWLVCHTSQRTGVITVKYWGWCFLQVVTVNNTVAKDNTVYITVTYWEYISTVCYCTQYISTVLYWENYSKIQFFFTVWYSIVYSKLLGKLHQSLTVYCLVLNCTVV